MVIYNNKKVLFFRRIQFNGWKDYTNNWFDGTKYFNCSDIYNLFDNNIDIKKYINENTVTEIKENSKLFFTKSSNFPRFKLSDTTFSKCIKLEKADYVVIGKDYDCLVFKFIHFFEGKDTYYAFINDPFYDWNNRSEYNKMPFESWISKYSNFIFPEIVTMRNITNDIYSLKNFNQISEDIKNNIPHKLITDTMLDREINKKQDEITPETYKSICELLDSPDIGLREVGLKTLTGLNVNETPIAVRFMIGTRESKLANLKSFKSVGVQNLLNTIKFRGFGGFPDRMYYINPNVGEIISDKDKALMSHIYIDLADRKIKDIINKMSDILTKFNIKVDYNVTQV